MPEPADRRIKLRCDYKGGCSDNSRLVAIVRTMLHNPKLDLVTELMLLSVLHVNNVEVLRPVITNGLTWLCLKEELLKCNLA